MRSTKCEANLYAFYDHTGMVRHLERMAARGWLLERIGARWRYRRAQPQKLRYCIAYYPAGSVYDPAAPDPEQERFWALCAEAGWEKVASNAQLHIFRSADPNAVPIETDAAVQVDTVHRAMKKSLVLSNAICALIGIYWLFSGLGRLRDDPVSYFSNVGTLVQTFNAVLLLLLAASALLGYFRWHRRAVKAAETGCFLPTRSHPWVQAAALALIVLVLGGYALSSFSEGATGQRIFLVSFGYMAVLLGAVQGTRVLLRRKNVSRRKNLTITLVVDVVLAVGMMLVLTGGALRGWLSPPPENATPYEWRGETEYAYHDPLPLRWEDLCATDYDAYSCKREAARSPLLRYTRYWQRTRWGDHGVTPDDLFYSVAETEIAPVYERCLQGQLSTYERGPYQMKRWGKDGEWYDTRAFAETDAAPWGAQRAWQLERIWRYRVDDEQISSGAEPENIWLLDYGTRLVTLNTGDFSPDAAQMAIIGEKLGK